MNREEFFTTIAEKLSADELSYVQNAYWVVKAGHSKQVRRISNERYFEHVRRAAFMAAECFGYYDAETIALGLLHDTIEDTFVPQTVIVNVFGYQMYDWIVALSKELPMFHPVTGKMIVRAKLPTDKYYANLMTAPLKPRVIKCCDRIDNMVDLESFEPERKAKYILETETYVLPLAEITDTRMYSEMVRVLTYAKK